MNATISDRYELGDRLGSGGMSTVYRATDRVLERTVAVKILAEHLSDDDKFVARFRREALAVAKLIHPNIVQVYDTGVDTGRHYIVMEYVEGKSVAQLLQTQGRLGPESAVEIGIQSCAGLEYAHRQGIIHRDVKPGNLMVIGGPAGRRRRDSSAHEPPTGEMTVKLTDFGIARASAQTRLTQVGSVVGTAAYLAPEQARGEEADPGRRRLRARRLPLPAAHRAPAVGGLDPRRARDPARERDPAAADLLRPRRARDPLGRGPALARGRRRGPLLARPASSSRALEAGLRGEEPPPASDELPTDMLAGSAGDGRDQADGRSSRAPPSPARRRSPRPAPPRVRRPRRARRAAQRAPRQRSGGARVLRAIGVLLLIAILAAIVAGGVLLLTDAGQDTDLGQTIKDNLNDQIQAIKDFIQQNTQ